MRRIRWESINWISYAPAKPHEERLVFCLSTLSDFPYEKETRTGNSILTSEPVSTAGECDLRMSR